MGVCALGVVVVLAAVGGLLLVTPGSGDAAARTAALARRHEAPQLTGPLPARVVAALIATEDSRFYSHHGIDPQGAARELVAGLLGRQDSGGATLDQQLAKLLYTGGRSGTLDRAAQVGLAVKLDASYPKESILRMYLDTAYFGHGYYGVVAASRGYFHRDPRRLSWGQASLLAGLVQAPTVYDPFVHPALARVRQRHVLTRLTTTGALSAAQARQISSAPLPLAPASG